MIINGGGRNGVGFWSSHLLNTEENERAEVVEISGLLATDLPTALREMRAIAGQSRCQGNFMYCANINPRDDEQLTPQQWKEAVDTLEKNLGMQGHQRVVVEHEKDGRTHRHVVWNRVDVENLRVTDIGGNFYTHERTARDLEERLGLARTQSLHGQERDDGRPERAPELADKRAAERSGITVEQVRDDLTEAWRSTDSGKAFAAAIEEKGYILVVGDRRAFCAVDQAGTVHSLARRIEDVKTKDVNARLADIDRAELFSVEEAKQLQQDRPKMAPALAPAPEPAKAPMPAPEPEKQQAPPDSVQAPAPVAEPVQAQPPVAPPAQAPEPPKPVQAPAAPAPIAEPVRPVPLQARVPVALPAKTPEQAKPVQAPAPEPKKENAPAPVQWGGPWQQQFAPYQVGIAMPLVPPPSPGLGKTQGEIRLALSLTKSADGFAATLDQRGMTVARVSGEEARASERASAFAKSIGNYAPRYTEGELVVLNSFGNVYRLNEATTGQKPEEVQKYLGALDPKALLNVADARAVMKDAARIEFYEKSQTERPASPVEKRILDLQCEASTAGAFAASLYRDGITIARVDARGIESLAADHRAAFQEGKLFHSPAVKEGELVAVNRFGGVHRLNPYQVDIDGLEAALTGGNKTIPGLGSARETITADRAADQKDRDTKNTEFWNGVREKQADSQKTWGMSRDAEVARVTNAAAKPATPTPAPVKGGLRVADTATGVAMSLVDFVSGLLAGGSPNPPPSFAAVDQAAQFKARNQALAALERIRDSMAKGENLKPSDVSKLVPTQLENIRLRGDDYMRNLIDRMEYDRRRERDDYGGRERER